MPDRLLYTISTRGKMSLMHYDSAFDAIYPQVVTNWQQETNVSFLRRQTLRFLDALGHCDYAFETREVFASRPMLVLLPTAGLPKAVLTGARNHDLLDHLQAYAKNHKDQIYLNAKSQKLGNHLIPSAIYLEAINKNILKEAAGDARINFELDMPAAWHLLNFSCGVAEAAEQLSYLEKAALNWPKRTFITSALVFSRQVHDEQEPQLIEYTNPVTQERIHWIRKDNTIAEIDRDWGRYIILSETHKNILLYDKKRNLLAVPSTVPFPRLLARAITLCCGLVPQEAKLNGNPLTQLPANCSMQIYRAVPTPIADCLSKKLGQELIDYELETDENGVIP